MNGGNAGRQRHVTAGSARSLNLACWTRKNQCGRSGDRVKCADTNRARAASRTAGMGRVECLCRQTAIQEGHTKRAGEQRKKIRLLQRHTDADSSQGKKEVGEWKIGRITRWGSEEGQKNARKRRYCCLYDWHVREGRTEGRGEGQEGEGRKNAVTVGAKKKES